MLQVRGRCFCSVHVPEGSAGVQNKRIKIRGSTHHSPIWYTSNLQEGFWSSEGALVCSEKMRTKELGFLGRNEHVF